MHHRLLTIFSLQISFKPWKLAANLCTSRRKTKRSIFYPEGTMGPLWFLQQATVTSLYKLSSLSLYCELRIATLCIMQITFYALSQNCEKRLLASSYLSVCLSACLSVCLSAWNNPAFIWMKDFNVFWNLKIFRKSREKIQVLLICYKHKR
jgi:hypothetical protein